ncbi:MAG: SpoIID/LytB domain-containing protein [Lachnospiraceae bacterium]|nr:SpoIID/LytB domain-containing protein [Lachnospiraceae bacterium]
MKLSKIVEKRTNKRDALGFLLFVFLLPYVCACLWGHAGNNTKEILTARKEYQADAVEAPYWVEVDMDWGTWKLPVEEYLVYRLAEVMQEDYEIEALKAQAVLLRTETVQALRAQGSDRIKAEDTGLAQFYYEDCQETAEQYWKAVESTKGLYLSYQGEPVQASYFKVSNGRTRDAEEVWHTDKCPYLTSVVCEQDRASAEWSSTVEVDRDSYIERVRQVVGETYTDETIWENGQFVYDEAGYVVKALYTEGKETAEIDGETFRRLWGLCSSSFEAERDERQIIFHVTGVGHGFGMSQYGANCRAFNGDTYDRILQEFFPGTELVKFE